MDGEEAKWNDVLTARGFGNPLLEIERLVVDVIHNKAHHWSSKQAEEVFEKYLKHKKVLLPSRVEIAQLMQTYQISEKL